MELPERSLNKMKIFLRNMLLFLACSCSKPEKIADKKVPNIYLLKSLQEIHIENDVVFLNTQKYTGFLYELSPSKDTLLIEGYINGLLHGRCKKWYPDRQLKEERNYYEGKKHGPQVLYWENGHKKVEFIAKNDVYEGELREWSSSGALFHLGTYINGQEEGPQKMWYENGKIRANYVIIKGKRYGLLGTKNCRNVSDSIISSK